MHTILKHQFLYLSQTYINQNKDYLVQFKNMGLQINKYNVLGLYLIKYNHKTVIDFAMTPNDKQILAGTFLQRLCDICDSENQYNKVIDF